jgi:oligopeptide/dipeptide ABC transporter ATP-binding protein
VLSTKPSQLQNQPAPDVGEPLIRVENLTVHFPIGRTGSRKKNQPVVHAVENVSFDIRRGETLGLVGESGSGKTTTGRAILLKVRPTSGKVFFKGQDITDLRGEDLRRLRRNIQLVFQDPYASLNPRMKVIDIVSEPLVVHGIVKRSRDAYDRVRELLDLCGLPGDAADRYPHAFSGGQRQRIGIARALALKPEFIVADEPVSALDVSIRAQIVNLLQELQQELGLTYLFIAHDLSIVRHISHRVAIMYCGKIVEIADRAEIYENAKHPYTEALLSAVPIPDPAIQKTRRRIMLPGEIPNPVTPPTGCRFHTRCPIVEPRCMEEEPPFEEKAADHLAACWLR